MRSYNKLNCKMILLRDAENPPSERINTDYKQCPGNPRKCLECGKTHDTIVENTMTGERIEELSKCKDCMLFGSIRKLERTETPPFLKELFLNAVIDLSS